MDRLPLFIFISLPVRRKYGLERDRERESPKIMVSRRSASVAPH